MKQQLYWFLFIVACVYALMFTPSFGVSPEPTFAGFKSFTVAIPNLCQWKWNGLSTFLPDPKCSPGESNPALTKEVLCSKTFKTGTVRNTSEALKNQVYTEYGVPKPKNNVGPNQVCEIDHIKSLELGGADSLANLFPQCSGNYAGWKGLGFMDKDKVENKLHAEVCAGKITLDAAQECIATDWTRCK